MPFSKLLLIFRENKAYYWTLTAVFVLLLTGVILGFIFQHHISSFYQNSESVPPPPNMTFRLILIFTGGIATLIIMGWLHSKLKWQTSEEMTNRLYEITETDAKTLSNVMSELAQGDLSTSMTVHSTLSTGKAIDRNDLAMIVQSIIQALQNCARELSNLTDIPCKRLCYVGADSFLEGRKCGELMGTLLKGEGQVIISLGSFKATHFELRRKGFENALRTGFPRIKVVHIMEDHENPKILYDLTTQAIDTYPNLRGIYITHGATPYKAAQAVQDKNKSGLIKVVGHDLTDDTMEYVSKGLISGTLDQNPYAQGSNPVILLYNYLVGDWEPFTPRLLTHLNVVTPENYQNYWHPDHGTIQSQESLNQLFKLSNKVSEKPLRIAVFCVSNSSFWLPVKAAVMNAREQLASRNTTVDWISPVEDETIMEISKDDFCGALQSIIDQEYDAIATIVMHKEAVPIINEAVNMGIPVITFNSEPISLQALIQSITDQADKLIH